MKSSASAVAIAILVVISLVLGGSFLNYKKKASQTVGEKDRKIEVLNVDLKSAQGNLTEEKKVNDALRGQNQNLTSNVNTLSNNLQRTTADLQTTRSDLSKVSTELDKTAATLQKTRNELAETKKVVESKDREVQLAKAEISKRDDKIRLLETERGDLNNQIGELKGNIKNLGQEIVDKELKLAEFVEDREFLIKELKRLQSEKAELEAQLNDLAFLREQVSELKKQLSVERRLDMIREGIFGNNPFAKGASRLQNHSFKRKPTVTPTGDFDLEVEITRDGEVKMVSPGDKKEPKSE